MSQKYKLRSVIICDDVRQEVSGKEILIGVYSYSMLFPSFPSIVPKLVIRIFMDLLDRTAKNFELNWKDPNGTPIANFKTQLPQAIPNEPLLLGFLIGPLTFNIEGVYPVELSLENEPAETIYDMEIRLPKDDLERSRVPAP